MTNRFLLTLCGLLAISPLSASDLATEELRFLFQSAEKAMQSKQWANARANYRALMQHGVHHLVDADTHSDLLVRLATAEERLGNLDEAVALLDAALQSELPQEIYRPAMFTLACALLRRGELLEARRVIGEVHRWIPQEDWTREERALALGLHMSLQHHYAHIVEEAERHLESESYSDAISSYEQVVAALKAGYFEIGDQEPKFMEKLRLRLAEAHHQLGHAERVVDLLSEEGGSDELFLLALAHRQLGDLENASDLLHRSLLQREENWEEVALEYAICRFDQEEWREAERLLLRIVREGQERALAHLAQVYRARIQLAQGKFDELPKTLHMLATEVPAGDPLQCEIAYLRAEGAFHTGDYIAAARLFEESLPARNQDRAEWAPTARYNMGWSYLMLGSEEGRESLSKAALLFKAEQLFEQMADERGYLALGRTYLAQGKQLQDKEALIRVEALLSQSHLFSTLDGRAEALLLRAEASETFSMSERLYREATDSVYEETACYARGWQERGLNLFEEADRLRKRGDKERSIALYESAATSLLRAVDLSSPEVASRALKMAARAHYNQGSLQRAFELLASLKECDDEALYLRALFASVLSNEAGEKKYAADVERAIDELRSEWPRSRYTPPSLHLLATMRFHQGEYASAEELFVELASCYPERRYAGDSWFWAAESAQLGQKAPREVRHYRQQVYERYPHSFFAAEAYFNTYSFAEYLEGLPEAIAHLGEMEEWYPSSPYLIVAHYLRGLDLKKSAMEGAIDAFEIASNCFRDAECEGMILPSNRDYFSHIESRARLERALIELELGHSEAANSILLKLEQESLGDLLEEVRFGLASVRLAARDDVAAEAILTEIVEAGPRVGYYVSRAHGELARILMRRGDYTNGFNQIEEAERSASGLSREEQLDLWIQKAICCRARGELGEAMSTLSRVINDESDSPLRMEAMFLRAEVYALQGRDELAIKQLEGAARKGGQWADRANEKLRQDYGLN